MNRCCATSAAPPRGCDGAADDARRDDGEDAGAGEQRDRGIREVRVGDEERTGGEDEGDAGGDLPVLADDEVPPEAPEADDVLHVAASFVTAGAAIPRRPLP